MVPPERIEHMFFYVLLVYFIPIISGAYNTKSLLMFFGVRYYPQKKGGQKGGHIIVETEPVDFCFFKNRTKRQALGWIRAVVCQTT